MSIASRLLQLNEIKAAIKAAIIAKGQTVGDDMTTYATAISNIVSGGSSGNGLTHVSYTPTDNVINFTPTNTREYGICSISANTTINIDADNGNDHYICISNTSSTTVTVALNSSSSIVGETAISIGSSEYYEISLIYDSNISAYIITSINIS